MRAFMLVIVLLVAVSVSAQEPSAPVNPVIDPHTCVYDTPDAIYDTNCVLADNTPTVGKLSRQGIGQSGGATPQREAVSSDQDTASRSTLTAARYAGLFQFLPGVSRDVLRMLGHDEQYVVDAYGMPYHVKRSTPNGQRGGAETWIYDQEKSRKNSENFCLELEGGIVRSGCVLKPSGNVCYYDAAKPKPDERPCTRVKFDE